MYVMMKTVSMSAFAVINLLVFFPQQFLFNNIYNS